MKQQESEKTLEARLVSEVRKRKGMAIKLTSQFHRGLPDRLVIMPYHTIMFVEMKSSGEKPTAIQEATHQQIRDLHFSVFIVDSTESLDLMLSKLDARMAQQALNEKEFERKKHDLIRTERRKFYAKVKDDLINRRAREEAEDGI